MIHPADLEEQLSGERVPAAAKRLPKAVSAASFHDLNGLKRHRVDIPDPSSKKRQQTGPRLNPLHAPYRTFKTQQAAFDFLDKQACSQILRTFATETAASGQREFIVTSAQLFWDRYIQLPVEQRHSYEIIRQASPCNLYFDLEYCPEVNRGVDGPRLVEILVSGVRELLQELYGVLLDPQHVLELDSSTASKFSRHLIFKLPGLAFADACHAGRFARCVLLRLLGVGLHSSCHAQLLVANKDGGLTTFVDMGVYTRNRAFRLYLSSKFGKAAVLRLTHRFGSASRCPKTAFHDCLISVLHTPAAHSTSTAGHSTPHLSSARASSSTMSALHTPAAHTGSSSSISTSTAGHSGSRPSSSSASRNSSSAAGPEQSCPTGSITRISGGGGSSTGRLSLLYMEDDGLEQELLLRLPEEWQQLPMLQLRPLPHPKQGAAAPGVALALTHMTSGNNSSRPQWCPAHPAAGVLPAAWSQPCYGPSPFPELDAFISTVCCVGGVQGGIRSWLLQGQGQGQGQGSLQGQERVDKQNWGQGQRLRQGPWQGQGQGQGQRLRQESPQGQQELKGEQNWGQVQRQGQGQRLRQESPQRQELREQQNWGQEQRQGQGQRQRYAQGPRQGQELRDGQGQRHGQGQQLRQEQGLGQVQEVRGSVVVCYNIKGNRWCGNVGRAHRSNGIFFCVDLVAGVYYQKCYDPECRHYRSNYMPLPTNVWQAYKHMVLQPDHPQQQQQQQSGLWEHQHLQQSDPQQQRQQPCPQMQQQQQLPGPQIQQQQQPPGHNQHAVCDADEDEECMRLLLHCEQQQHSNTHQQGICPQQPTSHAQLVPQVHQQQQPLTPAGCTSSARGCSYRAGIPGGNSQLVAALQEVDSGADADDDEWCVQLLQDVEQQVALRHKVTAG